MATFKLDTYRAEAKVEPFELELEEGKVISIPPPTAETMMHIGETPANDNRRLLQLLCGEQYEALWAAVAWEPASMVVKLVTDMVRHFGMGAEVQNVPGGYTASRRS